MALVKTEVLSLSSAFFFLAIYIAWKALYRLYFGPLAKIPGPKLAAVTGYYEAYYNVVKGGQFLFKLQELHQKYGPIIRIGPNELHINDPDFYDQIYSNNGRWDKDPQFVNQFDNTDSAFGTVPHELHRLRRRAFQGFFSKQKIASLEPLIQSIIEKMCARLEEYRVAGKVLPIRHVYECLTCDVIMEYALAINDGNIDHPDFNPALHETIKMVGEMGHYMKQIPGVQKILPVIPPWLIVKLVPAMDSMVDLQVRCKTLAESIVKSERSDIPKDYPTVCHEIYFADELPDSQKTVRRLQHEVETFVIAGTETSAHALACITFHVLDNPSVLRRLQEELNNFKRSSSGAARLREIEQLPYLTCVLLEGLRLSYGLATRLPRIAPDRIIKYRDFDIPPGTPVSMSSMLIHHNENIFPDPLKFDPQRWMGEKKRQYLERYLVNFSKGTRNCAGINLAWAELYLTTYAVFSRFNLQLSGTTREDVTLYRENATPQAKADSKGVRVLVL
ncbi:hypothetical protein MMC07_004045 [Pseudocyphellaria aurata]|nr:hypothetical protein [Pseudocyphellaria aurata]